MLREASLSEMRSKGIEKESRVLVNRGRGNDELAPSDALFAELSAKKTELEQALGKGSAEAHNQAFSATGFDARFRTQIENDPAALEKLEAIAQRAAVDDVYLVCYEGPGKACHRRTLMRIAEERFGTQIALEGVEVI
jgi:hypothetical protein